MTEAPSLVLGSGVTALGVMRTLGRAGIHTYVLNSQDPLLRRSRWYRPIPFDRAPDLPEDLETWLPTLPFERAVLFPCSDSWARRVAATVLQGSERCCASVAAPAVLEPLLDKGEFASALQRLNIPHPWSRIVRTGADLDSIPDNLLASAFLKPRDSQRFFQHFAVKAFRVQSRAEAAERVRTLEAMGMPVIVQEYIPGAPSDHYFVDGFFDRQGSVQALFARRRLRMYPPGFGNSSFMTSIPLEEASGAVESVTRLLRELGYRGMFSAEFKLDPRDRTFKILEVNARAWWYVEFAARCGVDVCTRAYQDALGLAVEPSTTYRAGRSCVYPYYDFDACRELHRRGELTLWAWARSWVGSAQPVFQTADPLPGLGAVADLAINKVRKGMRHQMSSRG